MTLDQIRTTTRQPSLDAVRGLAIALMLLDHVGYVLGWETVRLTLGRVSMPLFFLLAGALVTRVTMRHAHAALLGIALPLVAPWAGSPNVLVVYAVGAALLVLSRRAGLPVLVLVALPLAVAANRWEVGSTSYDPAALIGLMALGALVGTGWADRLGQHLQWPVLVHLGRAPLRWYVGNVLALQGVILWLSRVS